MYDEVFETLLADNLGRIVCVNIVLSIEDGVIDDTVARSFLNDWWGGALSNRDSGIEITVDYLKTQFYALIRDKEASYRSGSAHDGVLCATSIANGFSGALYELANVRSYEDLYMHILPLVDLDNGTILPEPGHHKFVSNMTDAISSGMWKKSLELLSGARLSKVGTVIWVSPLEPLEHETSGHGNRANRTRDFLGLIHHGRKDKSGRSQNCLFRVEINAESSGQESVNENCVRPTFIDAGFHSRFKVVADAKKSRHECGFALDLEKHCNSMTEADGGSEYVYREDDCVRMDRIKLTPLGIVTETRQDGESDRELFLERLIHSGRTKSREIQNHLTDWNSVQSYLEKLVI